MERKKMKVKEETQSNIFLIEKHIIVLWIVKVKNDFVKCVIQDRKETK